ETEQYAQEAVITGNIIRRPAGNGIQCASAHNVVMNDNVIDNAGFLGSGSGLTIQLTDATNAQINIQGNVVRGATISGVYVYDTSTTNIAHVNIANNQVIATGESGIYVRC
ncbi:hypothetical protein F9U38_22645, partial [Pectobacterium versatile]